MVLDKRTGKSVPRYMVRVDGGVDPETGKRRQLKKRFRTEREARQWLSETQNAVSTGAYVPRRKVTVEQLCSDYVAARHNLRPSSLAKLNYDVDVIVDHLGHKQLQALTKSDVDHMVSSLRNGGGKTRTGRVRRPWGPDATNKVIATVTRILDDARAQGLVARNVAERVDSVRRDFQRIEAFTEREVRELFTLIDRPCLPPQGTNHRREKDTDAAEYGDRLAHAWHLGMSGLRRGEIAGLRWSDVDFDAGRITVENNRVMVGAETAEGDTKTITSRRVLPMPDRVRTALLAAQSRQADERAAINDLAGTKDARGYERRIGAYEETGYVVVNELGKPYAPTVLSRLWREMLNRYGFRHVKLHATRSTCATLMIADGVPITVVAAWLGQKDSSVTLRRYATAHPEHLTDAARSVDW
ncbi:site-specific integrase [Gordonia alkanivorans]|nr:site-specific integrase [Gordonia alkanivorans]